MKKRNADEDVIDEEVHRYKQERQCGQEEDQEVKEAIKRAQIKRPASSVDNDDSDMEMSRHDSDESETSVTNGGGRGSRGRGRGRGRGSRGGGGGSKTSTRGSRGGRGGRGKAPVVEDSQKSIKDSFLSSSRSSSKKSHVM